MSSTAKQDTAKGKTEVVDFFDMGSTAIKLGPIRVSMGVYWTTLALFFVMILVGAAIIGIQQLDEQSYRPFRWAMVVFFFLWMYSPIISILASLYKNAHVPILKIFVYSAVFVAASATLQAILG